MPTLRDYFLTDKSDVVKVTQSTEITTHDGVKIPVQMFLDFASASIYLAFYLETVRDPLQRCLSLITEHTIQAVLGVTGGFGFVDGFPKTTPIHASDLKFCGRVFIYSDNALSEDDMTLLDRAARQRGILLDYHGPNWANERRKMGKHLAFISHDSRDKDAIAKPLVEELMRYPGCTVWYDEYSLKLGDHLRESIEKGLKESKKCILLLTKNFLTNAGWTREEFNSVFTRELIEQSNVVLPVWCGVSSAEVYAYSPILANRLAANWSKGPAEIAKQIYLAGNADELS